MLGGLEDLKEERGKGGGGERCIAAGLLGEILFDVPATAKKKKKKVSRSAEASECRKQISRGSSFLSREDAHTHLGIHLQLLKATR